MNIIYANTYANMHILARLHKQTLTEGYVNVCCKFPGAKRNPKQARLQMPHGEASRIKASEEFFHFAPFSLVSKNGQYYEYLQRRLLHSAH